MKKVSLVVVLVLLAMSVPYVGDKISMANDAAYDLIIQNGRVIDPESGRDEIAAVAIKDGTIQKIVAGRNVFLGMAQRVIDAEGKVVSPGFINTHTHEAYKDTAEESVKPLTNLYVFDGITFWLGGNCGISATGIKIDMGGGKFIQRGNPNKPMTEFLDELSKIQLYNNYAALSGNMTLRSRMGLKHMEHETDEQIEKMKKILDEELAAGSFGVSYGAMYDMGVTKKAMIALSTVSREHGGMTAIHTRYPTFNLKHLSGIDNVVPKRSIYEAIEICRKSGSPLIVSHITDQSQADSARWALETIDRATREGLPIAGDVIGHDYLVNDFFILTAEGKIPAPVLMKIDNASADRFYFSRDVYIDNKLYLKKFEPGSIEQFEFLRKNMKRIDGFTEGKDLPLFCRIISPKDTIRALQYPWVFVGNDAGGRAIDPATGEPAVGSPRGLATFSRLLGHWAREEGALSLHQALFKATIAPALWLGLDKKGRLQEGCDADVVIFDPNTIIDRAGWNETMNLKPDGVSHVIVNGQVVVENNKLTGATPGRLVRRTWKIPGNTTALRALYESRFVSR